jgi:hypothetical protein
MRRVPPKEADEGRDRQSPSVHCCILACISAVAKCQEARATHELYLTEFASRTAFTGPVRVEWHLKGF